MISHLLEHALRSRSLHVHGDTGIFGFERAVPHGIGSCRGRAQTTVIYALTSVACNCPTDSAETGTRRSEYRALRPLLVRLRSTRTVKHVHSRAVRHPGERGPS